MLPVNKFGSFTQWGINKAVMNIKTNESAFKLVRFNHYFGCNLLVNDWGEIP